nr:ribosomal protein L22 [Chorilaena euphemiae]YP_010921131.1 ribosomal protein L22 [Chorilaena euphemiae]WAJ54209.1 ribosomal protein L22 [Chorilaena euphemiae]WAJ54210.1 ribosomal protein L22 [Chorilaena euphemiae]
MIRIIKKKVEVSALGKHICMSAHKARRVIDQRFVDVLTRKPL